MLVIIWSLIFYNPFLETQLQATHEASQFYGAPNDKSKESSHEPPTYPDTAQNYIKCQK